MKTLASVMKQYAQTVITATPDYDTSEGVSMQYDLPETFFLEVSNSKGWDKQVKDNKLTERTARDHMQSLLEDKIEEML